MTEKFSNQPPKPEAEEVIDPGNVESSLEDAENYQETLKSQLAEHKTELEKLEKEGVNAERINELKELIGIVEEELGFLKEHIECFEEE